MDVHLQQSQRSSGRIMDMKKYFSGKHHDYGLKVETAHYHILASSRFKHDFQIFKDRMDEYRKLLPLAHSMSEQLTVCSAVIRVIIENCYDRNVYHVLQDRPTKREVKKRRENNHRFQTPVCGFKWIKLNDTHVEK